MTRRKALALCLSGSIALTGCASYVALPAPIPTSDVMPAWRIEGAVAVGADLYVQPERLEAVFGRDLRKVGVVPIQVLVQNSGERQYWLQRSAIALELPDGTQMNPVRATEVAVMEPPHPPRSIAANIALGALLIPFIPILIYPALIDVQLSDASRRQRRTDYWSKELVDVVLGENESVHGFVFFVLPPGTQALNEATLVLNIVDIAEARRFMIRLPQSGLGFKGVPAKAE